MSSKEPNWQFEEPRVLKELEEHLKGTYGEHYVGVDDLQTAHVFESLGTMGTTARDNAIKYLMRYGRKDGYNKKDLLKAMHMISWMIYYGDKYHE